MGRKKPDKEIERIFFTFSEAQEFLGISHQTLYKLMNEGLPSHKIGNKRVFLKADLIKWINEHQYFNFSQRGKDCSNNLSPCCCWVTFTELPVQIPVEDQNPDNKWIRVSPNQVRLSDTQLPQISGGNLRNSVDQIRRGKSPRAGQVQRIVLGLLSILKSIARMTWQDGLRGIPLRIIALIRQDSSREVS